MTEKLIASRRSLEHNTAILGHHAEAEGGCGVLGMIASVPIAGKHVYRSSIQMHNRGNGKGGGLAAVGLLPEQMGVPQEKLEDDYLIQIAYLDPSARKDVEQTLLLPYFEIHQGYEVPTIKDHRDIPGLEIQPPLVWRYFARVQEAVLVFNIVGYAEQALLYYQLEDLKAHGWIAHQRYPTKGRVWHPGGAHPFIGLNEALVHNLEYVIEALAPTTERDLLMLPKEKQELYKQIQVAHLHGSPDGERSDLISPLSLLRAALHRERTWPALSRRAPRRLRQLGRLPSKRARRRRDLCAQQRARPTWADLSRWEARRLR